MKKKLPPMKLELEYLCKYKGYQIHCIFPERKSRCDYYCVLYSGPLGGTILREDKNLRTLKRFIREVLD